MKAATELPACWWPLRWKGSFGEEHSDKISVWGAVITHAMGWSQASGFLELFLICSIITSCLFFQNVTSFPLIWPLLPQERNTALQTQYSGSSKWSQMCLSLSFLLSNSRMRLGWTHFPFHLSSSPWAGVKQLSYLGCPGIHLWNKPASLLNCPPATELNLLS